MRTHFRRLLVVIAFSLAGCLPVERFWWSPDGSRAVVVTGEKPQVHLMAADGELGPPLAGLAVKDDYPLGVSWLPDGSAFVIHRDVPLATWKEARPLLPPEEVAEIERHARAVPHLLRAAAATASDSDAIQGLLGAATGRGKEFVTAAFFCAREQDAATLEAALLTVPKGAEMLEAVQQDKTPFHVHEICLVKRNREPVEGGTESIARSIHPLLLPKVSPKLPAVAYWKSVDENDAVALEVSTLDGKSRVPVGISMSATFDWTVDGRSIVMCGSVSEGERLFQTIRQINLFNEAGVLALDERPAKELAVAVMPTPARLCALPDGRVLFASQPAKLPAPARALDMAPRLYLLSGDGAGSISEVPTAPGDLPTNLSFFVPSPDGKRVAVVESDTTAVAVVELATGKTEIVSQGVPGWQCRTMPAWKSATELTFAGLDEATRVPKWMLWQPGAGTRLLGAKWPVEVTQDWLTEKKDPPKATKLQP